MSEWQSLPLNQVCNIAIGGTPSRNIEEYWGGGEGFPWVAISDLHGRVITETSEKITLKGVKNSNVKAVSEGTVIMSFKLSIGRVAYAGMELYTNEAIASFDLDDKLMDNNFFYYQLPEVAKSAITDSAIKGATLNKEKLNALFISFPGINSQQKIAKILSTVDNLIEKTQSLIDKYTAIKQGMMADLFTRGIDMTAGDTPNSKGGKLRPSVEDAPELYKQTELGWVPKEWEVGMLKDYLNNIEQGWSPDCETEPANPGQWGVLKTTAVVWEGFNPAANKALPNSLKPRKEYVVNNGDVLMTRAGPGNRVGVVAYVDSTQDKLMLSDKLYRMLPSKSLNKEYLALLLSSGSIQSQLNATKTGLAESQSNISQDIVKKLVIKIPQVHEQESVVERVNSISKRLNTEKVFLEKLNIQKKGLMQDLLTGEVKV